MAVTEPVPEVLSALREPEPLWAIEHRIGGDKQGRDAIERARKTLGGVPRETLAEQAERLDAVIKTFPHNRVEAAQRADQLSRLRDEQREAHETVGRELARWDQLGPLSRIFGRHEREFIEQALASWTERAQDYDEQIAELAPRVDTDRNERTAWFDQPRHKPQHIAEGRDETDYGSLNARTRLIGDAARRMRIVVTEVVRSHTTTPGQPCRKSGPGEEPPD